MGLKVGCVLILWLGLQIETPKSNQQSLEFGITLVQCLLLILLIRLGTSHLFFLKSKL
jgi:hypothetical protein